MTPKEALEISRSVAEEIEREVKKLSGTSEAGVTVGIGKDGTPSKKIDVMAEEIAIEHLLQHDVRVVSEEAGVVGEGDIYVALDPIDGTFNAVNGIPFYSVTLCFSSSRELGDTFFSYVKNFATGDEYHSDGISYKNGKKIKASETERLDCNAIVYYPERRYPFRRMRIFGSASLEICMVAEGSFDCFIDLRKSENGKGYLRVYDIAASLFIAKNAGAEITDLDGINIWKKEISMEERFRVVVSGKTLHKKLLELV
ncbi:inositol monophosphatase family protein [Geoglobus acetivorans]|uniref:fructose-bisphosphatase n=1 Tax=Geoglobus acetivorans TaxID=565033 RepID=A0A0A7GHM3_GEOAI|nr:Inositol-1-monophosphatase [Geoglobus acetivorans]